MVAKGVVGAAALLAMLTSSIPAAGADAKQAAGTDAKQAAGAGTPPDRLLSRDPLVDAFPFLFDSEWIRLFVRGDSLEVRGTYWLICRNHVDDEVPLFYPFPRDSLLGGARMVSVRARQDGGTEEPVLVDDLPHTSGVRWRVPPCTGDTIAIEAVYRQALKSDYARYIVTTTRAWKRPLRRARFEIHLPPDARPIEFSFPFVKVERNGETIYTFEAESFLPDRDIFVRWAR